MERHCCIRLQLTVLLMVLASHAQTTVAQPPPAITIEVLDSLLRLPGNLGPLPPLAVPANNGFTPAKVELGRMLFFEKRLSRDKSISCATCHDPAKAYTDGRKRAVGIGQEHLPRRTPSLLNAAYNSRQFWDGRARTLEDQVPGPILSPREMGMDEGTVVARLRSVPEYRERFLAVFGREIVFEDIKRAIAAFERTLVTPDSAFDLYMQGDKHAITAEQKRGLILFFGKAACSECHNGSNFTDNKFHSLGLFPGERIGNDPGRYTVTRKPADRGAFKTPSLRNITLQAPYMHNGAIATLSEVIDFYSSGGGYGPKSELVFKLDLTPSEKRELFAFLQSLIGRMPAVWPPTGCSGTCAAECTAR